MGKVLKNKRIDLNKINVNKLSAFLSTVVICIFIGRLFYSYTTVDSAYTSPPVVDTKKNESFHFGSVNIPDEIEFAGEAVPLENFDVKEALDREMLVNTNFHSQTILFLKKAPRYFEVIEPILKENGIPDDFKFLALAESGFWDRAVSPAGAVGIWQIMKGTGRELGLEINNEVDERYHLEKSTDAACKYFLKAYEKYGNWTMAAASYNAGFSGIKLQVDRQKVDNYYDLLLNEETSRYVYRIIALKLIINDPEKYGFKVKKDEIYPSIFSRDVEISDKIENFADFAREHGTNYKILKYLNPWLRETYLTNSKKKKYIIKIPDSNLRVYNFKEEPLVEVQDTISQ